MTRVGYLVSRYPEVSHTFIRREIDGLRALGLEIETFSVRRTDPSHVLSDRDRRDLEATRSILPIDPREVVAAHLGAAVRRPAAYLGTLATACRHRPPGLKASLWALFHFAEAIVLARELDRQGIDHLHSHFADSGGTVGLLAAHFSGLPWSLTVHGTADLQNPLLLGEKVAASRFTVCASHFMRAQAMWCSSPDVWSRLSVARCAVDLVALEEHRKVREPGPRPRILAVGRLEPEKGFSGLVDAFADARETGLDAELRIIGDGSERGRLERRIAARGTGDRCTLAGAAPESEVIEEIARSDLLVVSSLMEGLPVVLVEALALEVPVIAPTVAGIPEIVEHGSTGWLYAPGDFRALADLLRRAIASPDERAAMGRRGRERVAEEFDLADASRKKLELFLEVWAPADQAGP